MNPSDAVNIEIGLDNTGLWKIQQTSNAANKVSELLRKDLETHHVFVNDQHFHNHASHQLLAQYGTGAPAEVIEKQYNQANVYQLPAKALHEGVVDKLEDWTEAQYYLGNGEYYTDWLNFFQKKIGEIGWEGTLQKYLFNDEDIGKDMTARMLSSFMHPLIQLMYGIEWRHPTLIAMGMAQAAVHKDDMKEMLLNMDKAAQAARDPAPTILSVLQRVQEDPKVGKIAPPNIVDEFRELLFPLSWDELAYYGGEIRVRPDDLEQRTAEMFDTVVYMSAAAAIHHGKEARFDFTFIHQINGSPINVLINEQPWIPTSVKVRWLEWKVRTDLIEYIARGCPPLSRKDLVSYIAIHINRNTTEDERVKRAQAARDDGHIIKLVRALRIGKKLCEAYKNRAEIMVKGELSWEDIECLVIETVKEGGEFSNKWVLGAGFEHAWKDIPDLLDVRG